MFIWNNFINVQTICALANEIKYFKILLIRVTWFGERGPVKEISLAIAVNLGSQLLLTVLRRHFFCATAHTWLPSPTGIQHRSRLTAIARVHCFTEMDRRL